MSKPFRQALMVSLLLIVLPFLALDRFLADAREERGKAQTEQVLRDMEDVLHRVRRNGRPEFFGKILVDQAVFSIRRGEPLAESLERAIGNKNLNGEFFFFSKGGEPLPIGIRKPQRATAWRKLITGMLEDRRGTRAPTSFEEKLAEQLLGDRSGINTLSRSYGHFRKLGNPEKYTHGGWWFLRDGRGRLLGHLLVFLRSGGDAGRDLTRAIAGAQNRVRGQFSLVEFGERDEKRAPAQRSDDRSGDRSALPAEVIRAVRALGGLPGRFSSSRYFGLVVEGTEDRFLVAWHRQHHATPTESGARPVLLVAGVFLTAWMFRFFLMGQAALLSLRLVVPVLILCATIPALGYLGLSMSEQRRKIQAKEIYEHHRHLESALRRIDTGFSQYLQHMADGFQRYLEAYERTRRPAVLTRLLRRYDPLIFSGYLFDETGTFTRLLRTPRVNPAADQRLYSTMLNRITGIVSGTSPGGAADDSVFGFLLNTMGRLQETSLLGDPRLSFIDMRANSRDARKVTGLLLSFNREALIRSYLSRLARFPDSRHGIDLALLRFDENSLTGALPGSFLTCADGRRMAERSLENNRTIDDIIATNRGQRLVATAIQGKNLSGFILLGAGPLQAIQARDEALSRWTYGISLLAFALALAAAGGLVRWLLDSLGAIRDGVAMIQAGRFQFALPLTGGDEFAQLARGVENAAGTLEELYSSRPVQESLVACEQIPVPGYHLSYAYETGARPCGDYLDAFALPDNRFAIVIGDTLGEGWQTTLVVAGVRMMIRLLLKRGIVPLTGLLERVQEYFHAQRGPIRHMTLWVGILDCGTGEIRCVSAGHCPPAVIRQGCIEWLPFGGTPLGFKRVTFDIERTIRLEAHTGILLHTNAWYRMTTPQGNILGEEAFQGILARQARKPFPDVIAGVKAEVAEGRFSGPTDDDRSMLMVGKTA